MFGNEVRIILVARNLNIPADIDVVADIDRMSVKLVSFIYHYRPSLFE
jgi:hypothetical protein